MRESVSIVMWWNEANLWWKLKEIKSSPRESKFLSLILLFLKLQTLTIFLRWNALNHLKDTK